MSLGNHQTEITRDGRKTFRWYVDFALSVIGGMCFLFGVVAAQEIHSPDGSIIDWKIAVGSFALLMACVMAARRRLSVLVSSITLPSAFLWLRFWSARDVGALWRGLLFLTLGFAVLALAAVIMYLNDR
jgi:hypothetical protein